MFFNKDYTKSVVHAAGYVLNSKNAILSFWDGIESPTRAELLSVGSSNMGVLGLGVDIRNALNALGGREIHQTLIEDINVESVDKTNYFNFTASPSTDTSKLGADETAVPKFAVLFFCPANGSNWSDDVYSAAYTFVLSVGELESGSDLELTNTTFDHETKLRVGTFTFNLI